MSRRLQFLGVSLGAVAASWAIALGGADAAAGKMSLTVADGVYGQTTEAVVWTTDGAQTARATSSSMLVQAECSQNGALVYRQYASTVNGVATLQLGPTMSWTGGAADCHADVGSFKNGRFVSKA